MTMIPSHTPQQGLSPGGRFVFALTSGLAVANVYYAQPLIDRIAADNQVGPAFAGSIVTATQIGYFLGLLLIVPLADAMDRRTLLLWQVRLLAVVLFLPALLTGEIAVWAAFFGVGMLSVVAQTFVAYAADLASGETRGRAVGTVTTGIILGVLLARTVSGTIADLAGWRAVFIAAGVTTMLLLPALHRLIPADARPRGTLSYGHLMVSTLTLFGQSAELRFRAGLAFLIFTAVTMLWTPMVLPLRASPLFLSHTQVGLFGLAGAVGALGASHAGKLADRGFAERVTGAGLVAMLAAWLPVALLGQSLMWLLLGVLLIDFGLQSVHVSNQVNLHAGHEGVRGRLTAAYMLLYSAGCAIGSTLSTIIYHEADWIGVCFAGAATSMIALLAWLVTILRRVSRRTCTAKEGP